MAENVFTWLDFTVFGLFLLASVLIGAYHAWKSRRIRKHQSTEVGATDEFLMGGRKMPIVPIALSLLTTFLSGVTLLGAPAEIYQRGLLFLINYWMGALAFAFTGYFFVPIFYKIKATSIYEYFEYRFDWSPLRYLAALLFLFNTVFYMSIVLYAPSVALSGVTNLPVWPFILIVGASCTLYTTIGGLKAVVWTDTLQAVFMYGGIAVLIIKGTLDQATNTESGISHVINTVVDSKRWAATWRFDPNPAQQNSFWISTFGAWSMWMTLYGLNQMALQRYCSMPSLRHANVVVMITIPCFMVLGTIACLIGVVMLGYFYDCDPIDAGQINKRDQYVILFAVRVLRAIPAMPGLFLACLFSTTLSTISSGMNSLAAVAWDDFLRPFLHSRVTDDAAAGISKMLVIVFGLLATGLAFACEPLGGLVPAAFGLMGATGGPLIGIFFLGIFNPKSSRFGTLAGFICAVVLNMTICAGYFHFKPYDGYVLDTGRSCSKLAYFTAKNKPNLHYGNPEVFYIFRISQYIYPLVGLVVVFVLGSLFSFILPDKRVKSQEQIDRERSLTFFGRNLPFKKPVVEERYYPSYGIDNKSADKIKHTTTSPGDLVHQFGKNNPTFEMREIYPGKLHMRSLRAGPVESGLEYRNEPHKIGFY